MPMIDADTEQRLRALALAASIGPWEAWNEGDPDEPPTADWSVLCEPIVRGYADPVCEMKRLRNPEHNAKYIAAVDPTTLLALLDTIAELRRDAERYRFLRGEMRLEGRAYAYVLGMNEDWGTTQLITDGGKLDAAIDSALTKQQDTDPTPIGQGD